MSRLGTRRLGATGLRVSPLALGTWTFGWSVDQRTACELMAAASAEGCNLIDTADRYGRPASPAGTSEKYIGRWLRTRRRDDFVIATKVRGRMGAGPNDEGLSRPYVHRAVDASLTRLRTDYIDLLQVHWPDPETDLDETLRAFHDLVSQGKVRYIGCSNFPAWLLMKSLGISERHDWVRFESTQVQYNLVHRAEYERELMPMCVDQQVGVFAYSPLAEGFLTGKYVSGGGVAPSSRARSRREVRTRFTDDNFRVLAAVGDVAESRGGTAGQVALAWVLSRPAITAAIVGARTVAQLTENFAALDLRLSARQVADLDRAGAWTDDRTPLARPATSRK